MAGFLYKREGIVDGIIDLFEDFLEEKGVRIENSERDEQDPEVGCFNVTLTDGSVNETYETQGDKASTEYSWSDFCDWLIGDIFEIYDIDQPNQLDSISIVDIQFAGIDNLCI